MKTRIQIITALLIMFSGYASAKISMYDNCVLQALARGCVIAVDKDAPQYLRKYGGASCFVGEDISPKSDAKIIGFYSKRISSNNLKREVYGKEINQIMECIGSPGKLFTCELPLYDSSSLAKIEACKYFKSIPDIQLKKMPNGISSKAYSLILPDSWLLLDESINKDSRKFIFGQGRESILFLSVSQPLEAGNLEEMKAKLKNNIGSVVGQANLEKISQKVINAGRHENVDEYVVINREIGDTSATYYIYGHDRIAIMTYKEMGEKPGITENARPIVEIFSWAN
jgi:hypothetical protein